MSELKIGSTVRIIEGSDAGKIGEVYNFYTTDGVTSVAVKFSDKNFGMYKLWHVEQI